MSVGGVLPVLCNGIHDAGSPVIATVDASVSLDEELCKGNFLLTDEDEFRLLPWQHSIWYEPTFLYPFTAVLRAQQLTWSIIQENFGEVLHEIASHEPTQSRYPCVYSDAPITSIDKASLSCISQGPGRICSGKKRIRFQDRIDLYIGDCQELHFHHISMPSASFADWNDKPWSYRPKEHDAADADPSLASEMLISSRVLPMKCRLTDEYHSISERVASASTALPPAHAGQHRFPPPAFVTDIFHLPGVLALPENFLAENGFLIRTWYVHHVHHPRWIVPRFVELNHEWRRWQSEIAGSWRDMIINHENVHFHTVMPDPDRSYIPRQVVADVIVSQGDEYDEIDRCAGLITIFQQDAHGHRRPYALAISLPEDVSGIGIAQAADITHICNTEVCHFYFGWNRIPYSFTITHRMLDGHGFVGHITPPVRQQASSTAQASHSSQPVGEATATNSGTPNRRPREHDAEDHDFDDDQDQLTDTSLPASLTQFEHWQGLQVYRLGRPIVHCFVRWGTYNVILHEVAHFLGEHLRNLIGIHHVQCALVGQHEAEESIILQHVGDLPYGSTEQLVILDVEVHFQTLPTGLLRAPEVTRKVHRVVPQITRAFVLRLARLSNYCLLQGDRCLVHINHELWAEQDARVRTVQHGTYLRVVATPPLDSTLTTEVALGFAISVDDEEAVPVGDCTAHPRTHRALALHQKHGLMLRDAVALPPQLVAYDLHSPAQRALSLTSLNAQPPGWRHQLAHAFNSQGFVECTEEGFVGYITTWYVDHLNHPRCEESRSVRLVGTDMADWHKQVTDVWHDVISHEKPLDIHMILPTPLQTETETTLAHLLLEQNRVIETHAAGIISVIRQDRHHAALRHVAVSIGCLTSLAHILRQVRLHDLCALRRCEVTFQGRPMRKGDLEDFESGFSLIVHVPPLSIADHSSVTLDHLPLWSPAMAAVMDAHMRPEISEIDDDISFFQASLPPQEVTQNQRNITCKPGPNNDDPEFPMTFPGPDLPRRRRPIHDGREEWIPTLWHLIRMHGVRDVWDDELTMQVTTWYIHHNRRTTCRRSRDIRLSGNPVTWIDDLRTAWVDQMDPRRPFSIWIIQPRPPQFLNHPSACHILLEQGRFERHVAVVLTALMEGHAGDGLIQGAFSIQAEVRLDVVVQTMELAYFCANRRCRLFCHGQSLDPTAEVQLHSGSSLCIRMEPPHEPHEDAPPNDPTEQLHFEDLSLMQNRNRPVQQPPASAPAQPAQACSLNPAAQVFYPDRPNIWLFPEFIQTLHTEFRQTAFAWESEAASAQVQVWFVDHRFHLPTCRFPRPVTLYEDFTDWEQRIKAVWSEYLQDDLPYEIAIVSPTPPQMEHGTAAHLILVQAPNDAWATSLVSIIDLNLGYQPNRAAITTPERVTFEHVTQAVGYDVICASRPRPPVCALWFELQRLMPGQSILGWNGFGFVLVIEDGIQIANAMPVDDTSFLQHPPRQSKTDDSQKSSADGHLKVRFADASRALDRLDTHFTLPTFDVEEVLKDKAHWLPQCLPWIRLSWYAFDHPIDHVSVYYDGSFLQQTEQAGAAAAVFVCWNGRWSFAGAVSAHLATPEFGSYTAEVRAALLATKIAYDIVKIAADIFDCHPSVTFVYDSLTVGQQAEGLWQAQKDKIACHAVRSILRIIQSRWHITCEHSFVSGHSGDPGNELVDTIAFCAAQGCPLQDWSTPLAMLTSQQFVQAISWGWVFQHPGFSQQWVEDVLHFPAKPQTAPETVTVGPRQVDDEGATPDTAVVRLSLMTCNVLTLAPGLVDADQSHSLGPARLQSLVRQFEQAGITIFALQETRLRTQLRLRNPEYHLWHSPANSRGHYGMLIGFAKKLPIAFMHDESPHQHGWLEEEAFAVIASDPRFLIIKVHSQFLKCIVISAHAPHSGADLDQINAYWASVDQAIPAKFAAWPKLLLADANCRFGDCPNQYIGDHDAEIATPKSEAFCHFVANHDLFLSASFASCHAGASGTWRHPNGEWTRNDVIGVSQYWPLLHCQSWTDTYIDVTLQKEDHRPARAILEWHAFAQPNAVQRNLRKCPPNFCMSALDEVKSMHTREDWICQDVHTHFHNLQTALAACTRKVHQIHERPPRKTTMSEETWALVRTKRKWRSNLASCQQLQNKTLLQTLFASWRHVCTRDLSSQEAITAEFDLILKQLDLDIAIALHQFRCFGRQVTQALRWDDVQFYVSLAQESSQWLGPHHTRQLWQTLRRNMPKFRQRRVGFDPLKIEALDDQWMPHFCQLEVGKPVTCSQLLDECHARQLDTPVQQQEFDISDLPTIGQLEDVLRQTPAGKATGFDVLPSQLFRQHPCDLADVFFPLLLKMFLWQHEPIAGKGGQLAVIHKKGSPFAAQNYRGIMLLPTFTKRVHALLRTHIMQLLHRQRPPGQLGGFAHQQVMYGSQSLQLFGRIMDSQNITSGILFLDLTTAFHRLVREWTSGINVDDDLEEVLAAMEMEGLPVAEMCSRLHLPCLLERLGAPAYLIQLIKDVHANTWMTVGLKQEIATTKRGTRPGSPLADCIFHVLMSDILHHLQDWIDAQQDFNEILQEFDVPGSLVAWADDLAIPWATRRADEMPAALRAVLSFVQQLFQRYGFLLNLDKGKTSAVVSFRGSGSPQMRQKYQLGPRPGDTIQVDGQSVFLHYVPSYKHSGTIFSANHKMDLEIRSRIGQAQAAFNQLSKPILGNRHLPERTRIQLFNSMVGTKLFFGLGAWLTPTHRQMAKIKAVLLRMLQRVLRLPLHRKFSDERNILNPG